MSETRYDAHPSMVRMRPFATPLTLLLMLAGILVALMGPQLLALVPPALQHQAAALIDAQAIQIAGILLFSLSALQLLIWWVKTRVDQLTITENEIVWSHGLLSKEYTEIALSSVRTVRVTQSLLQRLLNAGDVSLFTAGDLPELTIQGLPDPDRIRTLTKGTA